MELGLFSSSYIAQTKPVVGQELSVERKQETSRPKQQFFYLGEKMKILSLVACLFAAVVTYAALTTDETYDDGGAIQWLLTKGASK